MADALQDGHCSIRREPRNRHPIRIAFIGQKGFPATTGGVEYHVDELARRLTRRGHEVTVYVRRWYSPHAQTHSDGVRLLTTSSLRTKHLDAITHTMSSTIDSLTRKYDILHFHALGPSSLSFIPALCGKRVVVTVHRLDYQAEKWGRFARAFLKLCETSAIRFPRRTIVVSKGLQEHFLKVHGARTTYIPNGVPAPRLLPVDMIEKNYGLKGKDYILSMGRLVPEKRVDWLIRAFQNLKNSSVIPDSVKLVIAGASSASDRYAEMLRNLARNSADIIFTGNVVGDVKAELLTNALAFAIPSSVEGLPIALLEAMSYGLPCIASDIPPNREVFGSERCGLLFPRDDISALEAQLRFVVERPSELRIMAQAAAIRVSSEYDWEIIVDKVEDVYRSILRF